MPTYENVTITISGSFEFNITPNDPDPEESQDGALLLEDGSYFLLEDGGKLLLG